jgi:hypothetical protein
MLSGILAVVDIKPFMLRTVYGPAGHLSCSLFLSTLSVL